ncbi:hypothetical protein Arub01_06490 [Actinomadura rubrobrunea]|uniref:Uncharacterized protein n=1 Tax=Actinomadura rubrobrunea TaxID=115335 RepID=A0A9W6UV76_9ACTN|nr:hypothetical protein Arub01_06490 [Actinomadura rubrobrunea]
MQRIKAPKQSDNKADCPTLPAATFRLHTVGMTPGSGGSSVTFATSGPAVGVGAPVAQSDNG